MREGRKQDGTGRSERTQRPKGACWSRTERFHIPGNGLSLALVGDPCRVTPQENTGRRQVARPQLCNTINEKGKHQCACKKKECTMHQLSQFFRSHPKATLAGKSEVLECLEACSDCMVTCSACADACLAEDKVKDLVQCIRFNLDCADVCSAATKLLVRQTSLDTSFLRTQIEAVSEVARFCAAECEKHAHMEHCKTCAEVCRRCEETCEKLLKGPFAAAA